MKIATLEDVCYLNMGQSPDSSTYNEVGEGLPFYQGNADFGEKHPHCRVWCSEPTKIAEKEDILISVRAPIGALNEANERCCIGRGLAAIRPKGKINKDFLYYFLLSKKSYLISKGTGSTFKAISKNVLGKLSIPVPAMHEQEKRARILNTLWKVIYTRRVQLAKLDELVKCRFVELFGDPVEVLKLGKTQPLGTLAEKITVGYVGEAASAYTDMGVPYLRTQNVRRGYIDLSGLIYVTEDFHINNVKSKITPGDVVVSRVGVNRGMAAKIPNSLPNANIANCLIIKKTSAFIADYLVFYLNLSYGRHPQFGVSVGSAQGVINTAILKKWQVLKPDINLQKDFAAFIQRIDKLRFK